jgi:hypothetical protein
MKHALHVGLLVSAFTVCFSSHAQSNVYSISFYSGGVSSSPILQIGSGPTAISIWRQSYWTDSRGCVVSWVLSERAIQPTDKHHVETLLNLGQASCRVPFPPWMVAAFAAVVVLALAFLAALGYTRRGKLINEPRNPSRS